MSVPPALPAPVRFIQRDWLSANHVLLLGAAGNVLVDTGYGTTLPDTLRLLREPANLADGALAAIVNTHCHSDHMGGNARLSALYGCPVLVPQGEAAAIDAWDTRALLLDYAGQDAERFRYAATIAPGTCHAWGTLEWEALPAPGHDDGALMFHCAEHGLLITGDALWERGFGYLPAGRPEALAEARRTLERIAALPALRCVIPGHGPLFTDVARSLAGGFARLDTFEGDPVRLARHGLRVMLAFVLLARGNLALHMLPEFLGSTGFFREMDRQYLQLGAVELARVLVADLLRAGAAVIAEGLLLPAR